MEGSAQNTRRRWRFGRYIPPTAEIVPEREWHPLDGVPAPEYIPEQWTGPHVGLRLVEAFKTLANMPNPGIGNSGGYWPEYYHDWEDMMAQEGSDVDLKEEKAAAQNRARVRPSAQDITRMEMAIIWPGRYISDAEVARLVQRVAHYRARDLDMHYVAHRLKLEPRYLRKRNRTGLDQIGAGLCRDQVPVF